MTIRREVSAHHEEVCTETGGIVGFASFDNTGRFLSNQP